MNTARLLNTTPFDINKPVLDTHESAYLLGLSSHTLRASRHKGKLLGVNPPPFIKRGRSVVYSRASLIGWLDQFKEQKNTAREVTK